MSQIIASTYQIIEQIGSGGGGNVYLAIHLRLDKKVILKADKRKITTKPELLRREVDTLKNLSHAYIPQVYDYFVEDGTVYTVMVYPTSIDSQKYGHMEAEIISVDEYATNTNSLAYVLGSGNMVAEQFASNGPIVSVVCKIKTDKKTKSGYYWSSDSAKNLTISKGTVISAKIVVDECAPITKLIGKFKDDMEG